MDKKPVNLKCAAKEINVHNIYKYYSDLPSISRKMNNPYSLMLYNCHGDFNIGSLCRTASCVSARAIYTVGRRKFDHRTLVGAHHYTDIDRLDVLQDPINWFSEKKMYPVFIEQGGVDISIYNFSTLWHKDLEPCLVLGSECEGIPEKFMKLFPDSPRISITQTGLIRSLNVASAGAIALERIFYSHSKNVKDRYCLE